MSVKDHLEAIQKSVQSIQRESHITVFIKESKDKMQQIDDACSNAAKVISNTNDDADNLVKLCEQMSLHTSKQPESIHLSGFVQGKIVVYQTVATTLIT